MASPIQIYLDSSDYSNFVHAPKGREDLFAHLLSLLRTAITSNLIEVRYSCVHMSEICQVAPIYAERALERAQMIEELSRGRCLEPWSDLVVSELRATLQHRGAGSLKIDPFRENHSWFSWEKSKLENMRESIEAQLLNTLKERGINRRRRKALDLDGLMERFFESEQGMEALETVGRGLCEKLSIPTEVLPISAIKTLVLKGESPEVWAAIVSGALQPSVMIARLVPEFKMEEKLSGITRNQGQTMSQSLNSSLAKMSQIFRNVVELVGSSEATKILPQLDISEMISNVKLRTIRGTFRDDLDANEKRELDSMSDADIVSIRTPSFDTALCAFNKRINEGVSGIRAQRPIRKWELQDAGDIVHCFYAPYVDIFRCDTAWAGLVAPCVKHYETQAIGRAEDLLQRIQLIIDRSHVD